MQYLRHQDTARAATDIEASNKRQLAWLETFARQTGRKLRVLHIGNIANNAYNNAKIQRDLGIEADVLCFDYYHIMGTPEWEDADVKGTLDNFYPDWWGVDLGDWQRPSWFIQGPLLDCLDYLRTKHRGTIPEQVEARRRLVDAYWRILDQRATAEGRKRICDSPMDAAAIATTLKIAPELTGVIGTPPQSAASPYSYGRKASARMKRLADPAALAIAARSLRVALFDAALERRMHGQKLNALDRARVRTFMLWRRLAGVAGEPVPAAGQMSGRVKPIDALRKSTRLAALVAGWATGRVLGVNQSAPPPGVVAREPDSVPADAIARRLAVREHYRRTFSDIDPQSIHTEITHADCLSGHFADVMAHYDIIQGYSTDALTPLFSGLTRFCAYEHGTIREIPFENNLQGRLCRFTYRHAPRVFVTNSDVLPSIPRIGIPAHRVTYLPHAFNDAKLRRFRDENFRLRPPAGAPLIFSPTRHHWQHGGGSWTKGNDVLLRAVGKVHAEGRAFRLRLVEWGQEVAASKALIDELGYGKHVEWVAPMTKRQLWAAYCESHVIADQFTLPALGGVAFETLSLGRRLLTRIDEPTLELFFGAAPPLLNGATADEVSDQISRVLDDPDDTEGLGARARTWIEVFHSSRRVVALQARAYRDLMHDIDAPDVPNLAPQPEATTLPSSA